MSEEITVFNAPAKTTTPTSPNTDVVATPSGDANNTTQLTFEYQGRIPVWTPAVSQAQPQIALGADITIGATTWKAGITVQYAALGSTQYTVTITAGQIVDDRGLYSLQGVTLGIFPISKGAPNTIRQLARPPGFSATTMESSRAIRKRLLKQSFV